MRLTGNLVRRFANHYNCQTWGSQMICWGLGGFSLGLTGRYIRVGQRVSSGPFGASYASDGTKDEPLVNEFTVDAGAGFQVSENVRIGLTGKNLTAPGTALVPLILAGGIGYSNGTFTIEGNAHADFTTWGSARGRYMLGGEYLIADRFPVRLGYRYDDGMKTHSIGLGVQLGMIPVFAEATMEFNDELTGFPGAEDIDVNPLVLQAGVLIGG